MNDSRIETIRKIVNVVDQHQRFLVATHIRPDGDAVGSVLALASMLRKLGKEADSYCQDPVPPGQEFLSGAQDILHGGDLQPSRYEVVILVDCGELNRVGGESVVEAVRRIPFLINIDHHLNDVPFGNVNWVDPGASSTCELLYDLFPHLVPGSRIDPDLAAQLYTGLMTDTGSFRFSNTNQRVLHIAADLVAAGASPAYIAEQVFDSASPQRLHLLAKVLSTVDYGCNHRLATAELTQKMFRETETSPVDSEGFINHLRSVKSVEMAMLFREDEKGAVHVSLRSKGEVDVAAFARRHGGGGHRHAAALHVFGLTTESLRAQLTREAVLYLKESTPVVRT